VVGTTLVLLLAFVAWAAIGEDRATPEGSGSAGTSPGSGVVEPTPSKPAATPTETVEPVPSEPGATPAGTIVLSAGGDLWVAAPDGTQPALLVGDPGTQTDAFWSPDGSQVVYRDPDVGLLIVTRDGSPVATFTDDGRDTNPAWAPDGTSIAFAGRRSSSGLDIYSGTLPAPTEVRRLTTAGADDWDPTWSPDGDRIAFVTKRDGNAAIYTMEANGRILGRLTTDGAIYDDPAWSPNGDWIAVTRRETAQDEKVLWVMRSDGRDARRLTASGVDEHDPTWSPDGHFLAFVRGDTVRQIVIIDVNLAREVATVGRQGARNNTPDWR
jgi:Tol biopolymer transport system component